MTDGSGAKPAGYVQIGLPLVLGDRTAALSEILRDLAVPAVVAYSPLAGGTIANVLAAADKSVLSLSNLSGPIRRFVPVDQTLLRASVATLLDSGDEHAITFGGTTWRVTSPSRHPDDKHENRRGDRLSAPAPQLQGLAWTTRSNDDQLALMAGTVGVALEVANGRGDTRIVSPSRGADLGAILERGTWAMSHGTAIWQAGPEFGALIQHDHRRRALTWHAPWTIVDPSHPGQLLADGRPLGEAIRARWSNEPDLAPWVERFELDFERIDRLRVLSTRVPSADVLSELVEILVLPRTITQLTDPDFDRTQLAGFRVIQPRTIRQQVRGETLAPVEPAPEDSAKLRLTHPRLYVSLRLLGSAVVLAYAIYLLASGNIISGVILGVMALLAAGALVLSGAVARAWRRPQTGSPPGPEKFDNAGGA